MEIRKENKSDITKIQSLIYSAFLNHPHHEKGALPTEHLIVNKLRDAGELSLSLVCEDRANIIGHIAFSAVLINGEYAGWFGLAPLAVSSEYRGQGVGSALIREGLSQLKAQGAEGVVLLGEAEYYARFGFQSQPSLTLSGVPPAYFLALALTTNIPTGDVSYHSAFFDH